MAKGGRGGRGNIRFASPRNPAPEIAENGEPGQERKIELELKVLADVGLVVFHLSGNRLYYPLFHLLVQKSALIISRRSYLI